MIADLIIKYCPKVAQAYRLDSNPDNKNMIQEDFDRMVQEMRQDKLNGYSRSFSEKNLGIYARHLMHECILKTAWEKADAEIKIGTGATIILYTDRRACTITEIEYTKKGTPKRVGVRMNDYKHSGDMYDGECEVLDSMYGDTEYYTLRRNGGWYAEGQPKAYGSVRIIIGYKRTYIDPNF